MKKLLIAGAVTAIVAGPVFADENSDRLDAIAKQLEDLKAQNERLQAEVDYLRSNALAMRKDAANEAVAVTAVTTTASKYAWGGDFRYRYENIDAEENSVTRQRDRIRVRFGVTAKVNDNVLAKLQFSTVNSGNDSARSTNQTLGTTWDRKALGIDQAYVDWKIGASGANLVVGKQPMAWTRTASYFWDPDLTAEGAALKYANGPFFAGAYYNWLNERDATNNSANSTDQKLIGAQVGMKYAVGKATLTAAVDYFNVTNVKGQIVSAAVPASNTTPGASCALNAVFGAGQGTGNNAFGNSTYVGDLNGTVNPLGCTRLANEFKPLQALVQVDFNAGKHPVTVFADYMKNDGASTLNTAYAFGFTFNKASAPRLWEIGYTYQKDEKDSVFGQFHDSDFGGGVTDGSGSVIKLGYMPALGWTLNATYFDNTRFNSAATHRDYRRLQLDMNYKL